MVLNMYKISIIIPVFNVEDCLKDAFDSILNQTFGFENLEVIFVDDCSTDNSLNIIKNFANSYDNVKYFSLEENSGFAGKPRNIGIENASSDYLMFLDPDDIFLEEACEILYDNITANDLDMVSGNYDLYRNSKRVRNNWYMIRLKEEESVEVESVDELPNLLLTNPSVWAKIFKKEFILREKIEFLVGVPAQDLVFVSYALLKAKGIKFVNKPVVLYSPREHGDNKSVTGVKNKFVLLKFIKVYDEFYKLLSSINEEHSWLAPQNLYFWIKQLSLSEISLSDKIDLLIAAESLFDKFIKSDKLKIPPHLNEFFDFIVKKDYLNAAKLSGKLDVYYDDFRIFSDIKDNEFILLFKGIDVTRNEVSTAVFNHANALDKNDYKVTLLNFDNPMNFENIIDIFKDVGYLNNSVNFINIFDYYSSKNTLDEDCSDENLLDNWGYGFNVTDESLVEKTGIDDGSIVLKYFDKLTFDNAAPIDFSSISNEYIIKEEVYKNGSLFNLKNYDNGVLITERLFTPDGFNFISIEHNHDNDSFNLYNRITDFVMKFDNMYEFQNHFITEFVLNCDKKPFLINEYYDELPNFDNINPDICYKIANFINNSSSNNITNYSLKSTNLERIVTFDENSKKEIMSIFNVDNVDVIPNFIKDFQYVKKEESDVNFNKISIVSNSILDNNIIDIIKSFKNIKEKKNDVVLEIISRVKTSEELKKDSYIKELLIQFDLQDNVTFKDIGDSDKFDSLITIILPSIELFEVLFEYVLNSVCVVSYYGTKFTNNLIKNGQTGYLIKEHDISGLTDLILTLLDNPLETFNKSILSKDKILNDFDHDKSFEEWENILKEIYMKYRVNEINHFVNENSSTDKIFVSSDSVVEISEFNELKEKFSDLEKTNRDLRKQCESLSITNSKINKQNIKLDKRNRYLENCVLNKNNEDKTELKDNKSTLFNRFKL